MQRSLVWWVRILGVLLVLLGIVLLFAPEVTWRGRQTVLSTPSVEVKARRERVIVIPRAIGALILGAGVIALLATRKHTA